MNRSVLLNILCVNGFDERATHTLSDAVAQWDSARSNTQRVGDLNRCSAGTAGGEMPDPPLGVRRRGRSAGSTKATTRGRQQSLATRPRVQGGTTSAATA